MNANSIFNRALPDEKNRPHDMMLEDGWQDVADTIVEWLRERHL
jgi:hypothetical protein